MGTWAVDAFGNDSACDWAYELEKTKDLLLIDKALAKILAVGKDYVEAYDAEEAIAAAETIARLQGNFGEQTGHTEIVDTWVKTVQKTPDSDLCKKAHAVLDKILSEPSELLELWQESEALEAWKQSIMDLKSRINI